MQFGRASWYPWRRVKDRLVLRLCIRELAHVRSRVGYLGIWVLLRRIHIALLHGPALVALGPTERWSMDFVHDTLADVGPFQILTVVNNWSQHVL